MKPLKLVFSGVNSFSSRTEIDFEKLTAGGLFGIFGDTGSGKSTILDSINFALYGDVDRSKKKVDIINYNCDQAEVEFTFNILIDGRRRNYRVERSIKKKSGLGKAMLYADEGGGEVCIADNTTSVNAKIEQILGLSAGDFRKCIALPQGEFAQFVKSAPSERFKLIERLFSLNKYGDGLREKLSEAENDAIMQLNTVKAKYDVIADVDDNSVEALEKRCKELEKEVKEAEKLSADCDKKVEGLKKLFDTVRELNAAEKDIAELEKLADKMEKLRASLKSAPLSKAVCEAEKKRRAAIENLQKYTENSSLCAEQSAKCTQNLEALLARRAEKNFDEELEKLNARLAVLQSAIDDVNQANEENKRLQALRAEYQRAAERRKMLAEKREAAVKRLAEADAAVAASRVPDISEVLENNFKPVILRGEYNKQLIYFAELRESIKGYDDKSLLYTFMRKEIKRKIDELKQLMSDCGSVNIDLKRQLDDTEKLTKKHEQAVALRDREKDAVAAAERELALAVSNADKIKADGEQCAERKNKLDNKLTAVFGEDCKSYTAEINAARVKLASLKAERQSLDNEIEKERDALKKLEVTSGELRVKTAAAKEESEALAQQIASDLKSGGFSSVVQCEEIMRGIAAFGDAEKELRGYDERLYALRQRREQLLAAKGDESISDEQLEAALAEQKKYLAEVKEKHAGAKLSAARLDEMRSKLLLKKSLEGELKARTERRDLVYQLKELVKGNKFLEYIAGEYLSDISKAASATLLKLTLGRYYLSYTDTFYVADNFNEGKLRGVNTLSGGETFLVSLSLALALSSSICKSSMRSIEFFFLDEGFGTLDESLVDTVMDTLEKLRSSDFTIGIISHVEELKHRIDSKITVIKATETHGSTVTVSV